MNATDPVSLQVKIEADASGELHPALKLWMLKNGPQVTAPKESLSDLIDLASRLGFVVTLLIEQPKGQA